jgi:ribosomal protein S12 methylthiotransferase accessory factor
MTDFPPDGATPKRYRQGTHRACAPEETVARLAPLMPRFGITRVANLTGLDRIGVPVVMVCRPNARSSAVFHGKGLDLWAAKASGLMEAVESWHAEHPELPLRLASAAELGARFPLAEVAALPRLPASRFHLGLPMLWAEGDELIGGGRAWLPFELVHADGTLTGQPGAGCFSASTNGLASGNCYAEAVSHAVCEVIERDATSIWHRAPPQVRDRRRLDLGTVTDPGCRAVLERLEEAGLDVAVWETTTDVGVPAFQCLVAERSARMPHVGHGAGCHPAPEIALARALTEAVQVRTTYIVGSREDIEHTDYHAATLDARRHRARALMRAAAPLRGFDAAPRQVFDSFEAEVAWILGRLKAAGIGQAIAVDLSRSRLDIAVVRIVVPGLEGSDHHAGYSPGPRALSAAEHLP